MVKQENSWLRMTTTTTTRWKERSLLTCLTCALTNNINIHKSSLHHHKNMNENKKNSLSLFLINEPSFSFILTFSSHSFQFLRIHFSPLYHPLFNSITRPRKQHTHSTQNHIGVSHHSQKRAYSIKDISYTVRTISFMFFSFFLLSLSRSSRLFCLLTCVYMRNSQKREY